MAPLYFGVAKVDIFLKQQRNSFEFEKKSNPWFSNKINTCNQHRFHINIMHQLNSFLTFAG